MAQDSPEGIEQVVVRDDRVAISVDRGLYPLDAIYGAAYLFVDRCYVLLDAPEQNRVRVELRGREPADEAGLRALAGEFGNELLTQVWRQQTAQQNRLVIEAVTAKAMSGALGPPELDDLQQGFDADAFDDPLGIAVPWEEKYGPQGSEDASPAAPDDDPQRGE